MGGGGDAPSARPRRPRAEAELPGERIADLRDPAVQGTASTTSRTPRAVVDRLNWATERIEELEAAPRSGGGAPAGAEAASAPRPPSAPSSTPAPRSPTRSAVRPVDAAAEAERAGAQVARIERIERTAAEAVEAAAQQRVVADGRARARRRAGRQRSELAARRMATPRGARAAPRRRGRARPSRRATRDARAGPRRRESCARSWPDCAPAQEATRAARRTRAHGETPARHDVRGRGRSDAELQPADAPIHPREEIAPRDRAEEVERLRARTEDAETTLQPAQREARPRAPSCAPRSSASSRSPRRPRACAPRSRPVPATRG